MDQPSKLNERLTLIANISVVLGIIFLAVELRQNTQAIQAQTRDSLTEKQMQYMLSIAANPELAEVWIQGTVEGESVWADSLGAAGMYDTLMQAIFREWENSHYQYERGLFTEDEFQGRLTTWRFSMAGPGYRDVWMRTRERFAPSFRAEIDRIVAEVGG